MGGLKDTEAVLREVMGAVVDAVAVLREVIGAWVPAGGAPKELLGKARLAGTPGVALTDLFCFTEKPL